MAFPASIDSPKINWLPGETRSNHASQHNMIANLLIAIQNKIGTTGSTDTSSIQYFIDHHSHSNFYTKTEINNILPTNLRQFTENKHIVLNRVTGAEEIKTVGDATVINSTDIIRVQKPDGNFSDVPGSVLSVMPIFGGDGSDGLLTGDADITITGSNNSLVVKKYSGVTKTTSITRAYTNAPTVAPGNNIVFLVSDTSVFSVGRYVRISSSAGVEISKITAISTNVSITVDKTVLTHTNASPLITLLRRLTVSSQNNILVLRVNGNCDLSDWYIDLEGKGGTGGNGGTSAGAVGSNGDNGISILENVGTGGLGGTFQAVTPTQTHKGTSSNIPPFAINYYVQAGSGGGGGSGTQASPGGGMGGHGGGGLIIECTGTITLPSYNANSTYKNINLNAGAAVIGNSSNGGGAGGSAGIYYKTGVSGSISISYLGTIGVNGTYAGGYTSGGPNGGSSLYNQGQAGSAINTSSYGTVPQGGAGANGGHILSQITYL